MEALALLLLLLLGGSKKSKSKSALLETPTSPESPRGPGVTSQLALPAPGVTVFAAAWKTRTTALLKRGESGARWVPMLAKALGGDSNAATAAARWVGIESGGDPHNVTDKGEYGLAQGEKENYTAADWAAVRDIKTTDEQHATIAVHLILRSVKATIGTPTISPGAMGMGKLYHALPGLVKELRAQHALKATVAETLAMELGSYKPGTQVALFVAAKKWAKTGNVNQDLALRFFAPAAVVAYGDDAVLLLDAIAKANA